MDASQISPQLIAALLSGRMPMQQPPSPLLSQGPLRDPVAAMQGMMGPGLGAGGTGGGGSGMLGGLDPNKLMQLQQMLAGQQYTGTGGAGMAAPGSPQFAGTGGIY